MSLIVPWTDPGGTPCCCEEPLVDCTTEETIPAFSGIAYWQEITAEQYALFYAGGTWAISASANLAFSATIDDDDGIDPWSGSSVGSGSTTLTDPGGCAVSNGSTFGSGTATSQWLIGSTSWAFQFTFRRRLGTSAGLRYVSFHTTELRLVNPMHSLTAATVQSPSFMGYTGLNPTTDQLANPLNYSAQLSFVFGPTNVGHQNDELSVRIANAGSTYPYSYPGNGPNGYGMYDITETGTIAATFTFSPSAP